MSFKSYFNPLVEATKSVQVPSLSNYSVPGPKTRFQAGDIVLVRSPIPYTSQKKLGEEYFKSYHPVFCLPYMNAVGIIRLYYNNGYQSKYAIEAEDEKIVPIATPFIAGPFISIEAAKKYQGNDVEIDVKDLKGYIADDVQSNEVIESEFKSSFCNHVVGFKWLDNPVVVKYKKFNVYVLAFKKNESSVDDDSFNNKLDFVNKEDWDREDNPIRPEFNNGFVFCKVIDKLTNKLKKTSSITSYGGKTGEYFLQHIDYNSWWMLDDAFEDGKPISNVFICSMLPVNSTLSNTKYGIIEKFRQYEEGLTNGVDLFKTEYNLTDSSTSIKAKEVHIYESMLGSYMKEIEKYDIRCDALRISYLDNATKIGFLPNKITCARFEIDGSHTTKLNNLEGLERCDLSGVRTFSVGRGLDTLQGFPEQLNRSNIQIAFYNSDIGVKSLVGIPDKFHADIKITNLKSFQGAKNCTAFGAVEIQRSTKVLTGFFKKVENFTSWDIDEKTFQDYMKFRDLEEKHPELEGIFS